MKWTNVDYFGEINFLARENYYYRGRGGKKKIEKWNALFFKKKNEEILN